MPKYYYAVMFPYGENVTTGEANPITGRVSYACRLFAFCSKAEQEDFINSGSVFYPRRKVTKREFRQLNQGTSVFCTLETIRYAEIVAYDLKTRQQEESERLYKALHS